MKGIKLNFTNDIESPLFETEKGCALLELKEVMIDNMKQIRRIAFLVTTSKTKNMIWGMKLYSEDEEDLLLHVNWLDFN